MLLHLLLFDCVDIKRALISWKYIHSLPLGLREETRTSIISRNYWPCTPVYQPKPQWSSWTGWQQSKAAWWPLWCSDVHLATSLLGLDWHYEKRESGVKSKERTPLTRLAEEGCADWGKKKLIYTHDPVNELSRALWCWEKLSVMLVFGTCCT